MKDKCETNFYLGFIVGSFPKTKTKKKYKKGGEKTKVN